MSGYKSVLPDDVFAKGVIGLSYQQVEHTPSIPPQYVSGDTTDQSKKGLTDEQSSKRIQKRTKNCDWSNRSKCYRVSPKTDNDETQIENVRGLKYEVSPCLTSSETDCGAANRDVRTLYIGYPEGDEAGRNIRGEIEDKIMKCVDFQRDGCFGKQEIGQKCEMMETSPWILLYLSDINCDYFRFEQQLAIQIAVEQKKKKIICLISSSSVNIPSELKIFHTIVTENDWVSEVKLLVSSVPQELVREGCSLMKCPLSAVRDCSQTCNLEIVKRLKHHGKTGVPLQNIQYVRQKDIWETK